MDGKLRCMTSIYIRRNYRGQEQMLLLYRVGSRVVEPSWCGIGGHFEPEECNDARACVLRELFEEIGLREQDLDQIRMRYITLRLKNGEVRQNYYFFADIREGVKLSGDCDEGTLAWQNCEGMMKLDMPVTAKAVMGHYLTVGRYTQTLYAGSAEDGQVIFHSLEEF